MSLFDDKAGICGSQYLLLEEYSQWTYQQRSAGLSLMNSSRSKCTPRRSHPAWSVKVVSQVQPMLQWRQTSCFRAAAFLVALMRSSLYFKPYSQPQTSATFKRRTLVRLWRERTHSVSRRPGSTALMRIFGPCVVARHFIRWRPAALVTE